MPETTTTPASFQVSNLDAGLEATPATTAPFQVSNMDTDLDMLIHSYRGGNEEAREQIYKMLEERNDPRAKLLFTLGLFAPVEPPFPDDVLATVPANRRCWQLVEQREGEDPLLTCYLKEWQAERGFRRAVLAILAGQPTDARVQYDLYVKRQGGRQEMLAARAAKNGEGEDAAMHYFRAHDHTLYAPGVEVLPLPWPTTEHDHRAVPTDQEAALISDRIAGGIASMLREKR